MLRSVTEFLNELMEAGATIGRAFVGCVITIGIFWAISIATAPLTGRIEQSKWWLARFGYRHSFWGIAIPTMLGLCFAALVLLVMWGYATGRLPAR
jgi:hypothetical protein